MGVNVRAADLVEAWREEVQFVHARGHVSVVADAVELTRHEHHRRLAQPRHLMRVAPGARKGRYDGDDPSSNS